LGRPNKNIFELENGLKLMLFSSKMPTTKHYNKEQIFKVPRTNKNFLEILV
jgi:hypothetical protein